MTLMAAAAQAQLIINPHPGADLTPDEQAAATPQKDAVSRAGAILRVTCDPRSGLENLLESLLSGSFLHEAIVSISKDAGAANDKDVARVTFVSLASREGRPLLYLVPVESYDERVPAEKLLSAIASELELKLRAVDPHLAVIEHLRTERAQLERMASDLARSHDALWQLAAIHKVELDPAIAAQRRLRVEGDMQATEVELQGLEARRRVIEHQIAELAKKVEQAAGADPAVVSELKKSVDARQKILDYQQSRLATGFAGVSAEDVEKAKDELAQAEAELARYRHAAVDAAGGQRIAALRQRLDDTAIEIAETTAKRDAYKKLAEEFSRHSAQVELKQIELKVMEENYRLSREELARRQAEARAYSPPVVTVIPQ